jgi:hypothetical protein
MWIDLLKYMLLFMEMQIQAVVCINDIVFELPLYLIAAWVTLTVQNLQMFSHRMYGFGSINEWKLFSFEVRTFTRIFFFIEVVSANSC